MSADPADPPSSFPRKKPEDTAEGCRALAADDRERAEAAVNGHVRGTFERSAEVWAARATLLTRLKRNFDARAEANVRAHAEQRNVGGKDSS